MATKSGTLVNDVKSPYSSPYVHYSATYSSEREDASSPAVSVTLDCEGWLQSSASFLGAGILLTIHARIAGGKWKTCTVKGTNDSWNGTARHSAASLTVTGSAAGDKATVEFFVTRDDGGGNAGRLGSAKNPRKYTASLPVYAGQSGENPASDSGGMVYCKVGGVWKQAKAYVKSGGVWKQAKAYVKSGGIWKST